MRRVPQVNWSHRGNMNKLTPSWMWNTGLFVGTFILQSSVCSHWFYFTFPNDKRREKRIPVTYLGEHYEYVTSRLRCTCSVWKSISILGDLLTLFINLSVIWMFQSSAARGCLDIFLFWPQDGAIHTYTITFWIELTKEVALFVLWIIHPLHTFWSFIVILKRQMLEICMRWAQISLHMTGSALLS